MSDTSDNASPGPIEGFQGFQEPQGTIGVQNLGGSQGPLPELSNDAKRQLIENYLAQFAVDAFGHTLNREVAVTKGDTEAVTRADAALADIATATATYQAQLDALP